MKKKKEIFGTYSKVAITVRDPNDGSAHKIGDGKMCVRGDGSITFELFQDTTELKLEAGEQYKLVIKPGSEKTIYKSR